MYLDKNGFPAKATPNHPTFTDSDPTTVCFTEDGGAQVWWNVISNKGNSYRLERQDNSTVCIDYVYEQEEKPINPVDELEKENVKVEKPKADKPRTVKKSPTKKPRRKSPKKPK